MIRRIAQWLGHHLNCTTTYFTRKTCMPLLWSDYAYWLLLRVVTNSYYHTESFRVNAVHLFAQFICYFMASYEFFQPLPLVILPFFRNQHYLFLSRIFTIYLFLFFSFRPLENLNSHLWTWVRAMTHDTEIICVTLWLVAPSSLSMFLGPAEVVPMLALS